MKKNVYKNKQAQFYLLAAIIIIAIILGFAAVSNYAKKKKEVKIYDLRDELNIESANVLDYGTYREEEVNIKNLLEHFTGLYTAYAGEGKELYFIFGNENGIEVHSYIEITQGIVIVDIPGGYSIFEIRGKQKKEQTFFGEEVTVTINNYPYTFKLTSGENFYFVISQNIGGEQYVVSQED